MQVTWQQLFGMGIGFMAAGALSLALGVLLPTSSLGLAGFGLVLLAAGLKRRAA